MFLTVQKYLIICGFKQNSDRYWLKIGIFIILETRKIIGLILTQISIDCGGIGQENISLFKRETALAFSLVLMVFNLLDIHLLFGL